MKVAEELSYKGYRLLVSQRLEGYDFFLLARHLRCPKVLQRLRKVPKKRLLPRQRKLSTHGSMHKIDELSARCSCVSEAPRGPPSTKQYVRGLTPAGAASGRCAPG